MAYIMVVQVAALTMLVLAGCDKDDDFTQGGGGGTGQPKEYLVSYSPLGDVSISAIQSITYVAGYPQLNAYLKHPIELYKIVYNTTYKGQPILASGVISYPVSTADSLPTLIVGNGLIFADEDAPSEFDLPENYTGFEFIASLGFVTFIPDMIGFGVSKDLLYPIHNLEHSAQTMIDFIMAGEEFIRELKLNVSGRKFMTGYSQGGYIAMATLKVLEEMPDTDIEIESTAVGAGGFNLVNLLDYAISENTYSAPSHLAMLFSSYNEIYEWNRPLTDFFQEPYAGRIPGLLEGAYNREEIDLQLAYSFDSLMNPDFLDDIRNGNEPELIQALEENSVDDWGPRSPLTIIHSVNDDRIPVTDSEDTYLKMIGNGSTTVTFVPIDTEGHINAALSFVEIVLNMFSSLL